MTPAAEQRNVLAQQIGDDIVDAHCSANRHHDGLVRVIDHDHVLWQLDVRTRLVVVVVVAHVASQL